VGRAHDREVSSVESRNLSLVEALTECDDGCVDESEVEVVVVALEIGCSPQVVDRERFEAVCARADVIDEDVPRRRAEEFAGPVVDLDEDAAGDDEILLEVVDERDRPCVCGIARVEEGQDRSRVEDKYHYVSARLRIGACSSVAAICAAPLDVRAIPNRGLWAFRSSFALCTTNSRSTWASETPRRRASASRRARSSGSAASVVRRTVTHQMLAS